jgi:HPt (histidine-containing phosphotransfer) domain-containing protein
MPSKLIAAQNWALQTRAISLLLHERKTWHVFNLAYFDAGDFGKLLISQHLKNNKLDKLENDPARITKYTTRFLETTHDTLTEMRAALAQKDLATLGALGHRLKSAARTVGAMRFGDICGQIEQLKISNNPEAAHAAVDQLLGLFEQITQRLKQPADS